MDFSTYQEKTEETAIYSREGLKPLAYVGFGLAGEVGEVSELLKKAIRDNDGVITEERLEKLKKEIGDIMWYVSQLCTELGLDLNEIAELNIAKLASRKERGVLHGSGSDR